MLVCDICKKMDDEIEHKNVQLFLSFIDRNQGERIVLTDVVFCAKCLKQYNIGLIDRKNDYLKLKKELIKIFKRLLHDPDTN